MGFERFGAVSFTSETKASDFVTHLDEGKLEATKCNNCGSMYFPPRMDCANCFSQDISWFDLGNEGKLATYTIVNYGPSGFENDAPYTLALVEFPSGVKVFGRLDKQLGADDIKVGMAVQPSTVILSDERVTYEFKKI